MVTCQKKNDNLIVQYEDCSWLATPGYFSSTHLWLLWVNLNQFRSKIHRTIFRSIFFFLAQCVASRQRDEASLQQGTAWRAKQGMLKEFSALMTTPNSAWSQRLRTPLTLPVCPTEGKSMYISCAVSYNTRLELLYIAYIEHKKNVKVRKCKFLSQNRIKTQWIVRCNWEYYSCILHPMEINLFQSLNYVKVR